MLKKQILPLFVTTALVACALSTISAQYRSRTLFYEIERAHAATKQLDLEWAQLQLDQTVMAKHSRVDELARTKLSMGPATPARTQYVVATQQADGR